MYRPALILLVSFLSVSCSDITVSTDADDPPRKAGGVVTTGQRITPAGMQTVVQGRVRGLAFGVRDDELLVLIEGSGGEPSGVMRLGWHENRLLDRVPFPGGSGSPGLQGIRLDAHRAEVYVSHAGTLPDWKPPADNPKARAPSGALLARLIGDRLQVIAGVLGRREVGAAGIAKASGEGRRAIAPLCSDNQFAILDLGTGEVLGKVPKGIAPFGAVIDEAGTTASVTNWTGRVAEAGDLTAKAERSSSSDDVVVDARGIASTATVTRIDLLHATATGTIDVGLHLTAIDEDATP